MTWWHYLLLVNFYLILFFGFYALLLRKETFFQLNRVYLVAASLLSFLIPLIQADWVTNLFITQQVQQTVYGGTLMNLAPVLVVTGKSAAITLGEIVNAVYITVTVLLVIRLGWQLLVLKKAISRPSPSAAYSFFKKISLGEHVAQSSVIAEHEAVHASQWHSVDVMIIEAVMIINWFNPVVYLYRFAIKYIHEFIADRQVIERGTNKVDYALLLLSQTFETDTHNLVTPFYNHSLLKERIKMLQKNKSQRIMLAKYGLSAPLFMLMLILSSATVKSSKAINIISKKTEKVLQTPTANVLDMVENNGKTSTANNIKPEQLTIANTGINEEVAQPKADTIPDKVFNMVERQPMFPGGMQGFVAFLAQTVRYPAGDRNNKVSGRAIVTFVVEKDGTLSNITPVRGPSETIKQAAVDALSKSPKWEPGYQNGKPVRVQFTVPINFALDNATTVPAAAQPDASDMNRVYNQVAKMPTFPGGLSAFLNFITQNIRYPKEDRERGLSGRVICTMVIEKDGTLSNIAAIRGPSEEMKAEAIRVLKMSPKWVPGADKDGKPARVAFTLPLSFVLEAQDGSSQITSDILAGKIKIGEHQPLYVIDGVKYAMGDKLPGIKQSDIASMEVLKDETAVKLYGGAAKNGAIIVTTIKKK